MAPFSPVGFLAGLHLSKCTVISPLAELLLSIMAVLWLWCIMQDVDYPGNPIPSGEWGHKVLKLQLPWCTIAAQVDPVQCQTQFPNRYFKEIFILCVCVGGAGIKFGWLVLIQVENKRWNHGIFQSALLDSNPLCDSQLHFCDYSHFPFLSPLFWAIHFQSLHSAGCQGHYYDPYFYGLYKSRNLLNPYPSSLCSCVRGQSLARGLFTF